MVLRPPISLTFVKLKCLTFPPTSGKQKPTTMKKSMLFGAMAIMTMGAFAQEGLTSKKGEAYLPETDDWAISFDAVPFLNYAGNLFSGSTSSNSSPGANWVNPTMMTITGKMFKDEKTAYRATIRLGMNSYKETEQINDATVTTPPTYPNAYPQKEDEMKQSSRAIGLGGGLEMRRGKTRLQGFYGGEALIWLSGGKNTFTYGNALSVGATPVGVGASTDFGASATSQGSNITTDDYGNAARVLEEKVGSTFGFGVRGFIGAEYFVMPKISIGAEYGWGIGISKTGATETKMESVGGSPASVGSLTETSGKSGSFGLDTDINDGGSGTGTAALKITFHF